MNANDNNLNPGRLGGSAEDQEVFRQERARSIAEFRRKLASGEPIGDVPDPLTAEDEEILDRVWAED